MNRPKTFTIVMLLALCVGAAALLRNAGAAAAVDSPTTITLTAPPGGKTTNVDVGRNDRDHGSGDFTVITGAPLHDAGSHAVAGHLDGIETILSAKASELRAEITLSTGTVELDGVLNPEIHTNTLAITGGTGAYSNARGTVTTTTSQRTHAATLTLRLLP
jgi:hypothetical protein